MVLARIRQRLGRSHHLRRVSLEKARPRATLQRREPLPQCGEKLFVAALAALAATLLLGLGSLSSLRAWCALAGLVALGTAALVRYLTDFRRDVLANLPRVVGLAAALLGPLLAVVVAELLGQTGGLSWLPLSFVSLVLALVWGRSLAIEGTVVASALLLLHLGLRERLGGAALDGLTVAFGGGLTAALISASLKRRSALVRIGLAIGGVQAALAASLIWLEPGPGAAGTPLWDLAAILLAGVAVGLLVSGLLPAIEGLFDVTTDVSLLELGNTNEAPLLRKLLLEASGSFHHSYIVGLMAEAAAEAIGANALLARVGALYHDVGKLNKSEYFAENSSEARDRHDALAPEMSMLIISAHTRDGVELGRYYGLPEAILDFMVEHHGTTCIEYFYHRAVQSRGEENVSEAAFRYSGPKPQSRETAIVMIADAAEAISRQVPDPTPARLGEMVHNVAMKRLLEGQFSECGLTLAELTRIEEVCVQVLGAIFHTRPTYPKGRPHPLDLSQPGAKVEIPTGGRERAPVAGGPQ